MGEAIRLAIVGAGGMARVRGRAMLATGGVELVGVAARRLASAQGFGLEFGCARCVDDYRALLADRPDALLVEVPHAVQDEVVLWALEHGLHVLIGGTLATSAVAGARIKALATERELVVEAGFQARYMPLWEQAREFLATGALGRVTVARTIALWAGDPSSWYYSQQISGGMPLTHMSYCFINPLRWLFGDPTQISAFSNRLWQTAPGLIDEETVVANLRFPGDVLCSMTAGFVKPGELPSWSVTLVGTEAALQIDPVDLAAGAYTLYHGSTLQRVNMDGDGFLAQSHAFLAALHGAPTCRNTPADTVGDLLTAEAIVIAAREKRVVELAGSAGVSPVPNA